MELGEGEVMKCLIDLELEVEFNVECHQQVLSYKYFMSRSIKLDKPLLNACREDAQKLCMTELEEEEKLEHKPHGAVISCLYHHIFSDSNEKLSTKCLPELKRQ
ncbi:Golgi apparatus protein 1-like [Bolinopsis microptera]|uniref:Golgi apparatus protein 1-like n=1 Tax=Bolinopsis microptera TaxID=2820187 RepID=UPI00307979C1